MAIVLGNKNLRECYIGNQRVKAIYIGSTQYWGNNVIIHNHHIGTPGPNDNLGFYICDADGNQYTEINFYVEPGQVLYLSGGVDGADNIDLWVEINNKQYSLHQDLDPIEITVEGVVTIEVYY